MALLDLSSEIVDLWERIGKDKKDLEKRILHLVETELLRSLKPNEYSLTKWKTSENGRRDFTNYVVNKLGYYPPTETVEILWRYYTNRLTRKRSKSLVLSFAETVEKKCMHCGSIEGPFHIDHIVPLAKGGRDEVENLQCLCSICNQKKGANLDINFNVLIKRR
ncbi:HNH endonuclease [Neobacillus drentensis]|uniref:HNH endonuclease n=1 Tax=Neobacillus drentensis TaxID=220684 RepID=UPI0030016852